MHDFDHECGKPNPKAPSERSRFAFLVGSWQCEARIRLDNGAWQTFEAIWIGRFILDGYAIANEYRMTNSSRELIVLGLNLRTYDAARKTWHLKWRNALAGTWTDLGPEEFGGVTFDGWSIIHSFKEPVASHAIRASLTSTLPQPISRGAEEKSDGANVWSEFMIIEAQRTNEWETATNR